MNSSTIPSWSRYFSRRCCLQMSAVCFCRFLVPSPIGNESVLLLQMTTLENHDLSDAAKRAAESWRQLAQVPKLCSDFREMDSSVSDDNIARGTPSPVWAVKEYLH